VTTNPADDPIGLVRIEQHDGGHSVWLHTGGTPGNEWLCVWSTAGGNIGCTLPPDDVAGMCVASGIPGTPAAAMVEDGDLRERLAEQLRIEWDYQEVNSACYRAVDEALRLLGPELQRVAKLAEANGNQARFWSDHFDEVEKANRDALGAHHKPGYSVAELITALVAEVGQLTNALSVANRTLVTERKEAASRPAITADAVHPLRDLDVLAYRLGLTQTIADDGREVERLSEALKATAVKSSGCGKLDWCDACNRHVPHGSAPVSGSDTGITRVPTGEHWITEEGHRLREHKGKLWYWGHPDASGNMAWYEDAFPDLDAVRRQGHELTLVPARSVRDTSEDGGDRG
jgi:hypothetical protein